jgi:hypothetical protein
MLDCSVRSCGTSITGIKRRGSSSSSTSVSLRASCLGGGGAAFGMDALAKVGMRRASSVPVTGVGMIAGVKVAMACVAIDEEARMRHGREGRGPRATSTGNIRWRSLKLGLRLDHVMVSTLLIDAEEIFI